MRIVAGLLGVLVIAGLAGCSSSPSNKPVLPASAVPASSGEAAAPAGGRAAPTPNADLVPAVVGIPTSHRGSAVHRISPGDVLAVNVFQVEDLSTDERVSDRGTIVMPLIGAVTVGGLSTEDAERRIETALQKNYLQNPQVDIFVSEYANMNVTVGGAVEEPGVFPLTGRTTLMQAIAQAGGVDNLANPKEVIVFRSEAPTGVNAYVVDLKAIEAGDLSDPPLMAGDKVMVSESGTRAFIKDATGVLRGFVRPFLF